MSGEGVPTETGSHPAAPPSDEPPGPEAGSAAESVSARRPRTVRVSVLVWLVLIALGAGYLLGHPRPPLDDSADAGFLRDMSAHHAQAVEMALLMLDRTDEPLLSTVSYDIATTQQAQIGRMRGQLDEWGLSARGSDPPMSWMSGHGHGGGADGAPPATMPGLATPAQMDKLRDSDGADAEVLYLRLMIAHHKGGVRMAEAGADLADDPDLVDFADGMAAAQRSENDLLNELLAKRVD